MESRWQRTQHLGHVFLTPLKVENNDTGDVACDSYHKIAEDLSRPADPRRDPLSPFHSAWTASSLSGTNKYVNRSRPELLRAAHPDTLLAITSSHR